MGCRRRLRRSERRGRRARKTSTRDANKPEEEKNWWALAHFRRLGAGAVGVNLARSDARIGSANKLGSGLALCWSRSFYCFCPKLVFSTTFWALLEMLLSHQTELCCNCIFVKERESAFKIFCLPENRKRRGNQPTNSLTIYSLLVVCLQIILYQYIYVAWWIA